MGQRAVGDLVEGLIDEGAGANAKLGNHPVVKLAVAAHVVFSGQTGADGLHQGLEGDALAGSSPLDGIGDALKGVVQLGPLGFLDLVRPASGFDFDPGIAEAVEIATHAPPDGGALEGVGERALLGLNLGVASAVKLLTPLAV